jgi:hypothetical protein
MIGSCESPLQLAHLLLLAPAIIASAMYGCFPPVRWTERGQGNRKEIAMVVFIENKWNTATKHGRVEADPSPDRIREMTDAIRSNWTPEERKRRAAVARYVQLKHLPLWPGRAGVCEDRP